MFFMINPLFTKEEEKETAQIEVQDVLLMEEKNPACEFHHALEYCLQFFVKICNLLLILTLMHLNVLNGFVGCHTCTSLLICSYRCRREDIEFL